MLTFITLKMLTSSTFALLVVYLLITSALRESPHLPACMPERWLQTNIQNLRVEDIWVFFMKNLSANPLPLLGQEVSQTRTDDGDAGKQSRDTTFDQRWKLVFLGGSEITFMCMLCACMYEHVWIVFVCMCESGLVGVSNVLSVWIGRDLFYKFIFGQQPVCLNVAREKPH